MPPRLFVDRPLVALQAPAGDSAFALPPGAARHVQVLRLQPGDALLLFDGSGGEWRASVVQMGRRDVTVRLVGHEAVDRELASPVTLALGMPANERMDALVEKATELGVAAIQPLMCERAVLRLTGERADKKVAHWQAVAVAACEQSGRTRVPVVAPVCTLAAWVRGLPPLAIAGEGACSRRWLLSLRGEAPVFSSDDAGRAPVTCLSGPEGGLSDTEEAAAIAAGFVARSLGPRVLRADTAPLALLAYLGLAG